MDYFYNVETGWNLWPCFWAAIIGWYLLAGLLIRFTGVLYLVTDFMFLGEPDPFDAFMVWIFSPLIAIAIPIGGTLYIVAHGIAWLLFPRNTRS